MPCSPIVISKWASKICQTISLRNGAIMPAYGYVILRKNKREKNKKAAQIIKRVRLTSYRYEASPWLYWHDLHGCCQAAVRMAPTSNTWMPSASDIHNYSHNRLSKNTLKLHTKYINSKSMASQFIIMVCFTRKRIKIIT